VALSKTTTINTLAPLFLTTSTKSDFSRETSFSLNRNELFLSYVSNHFGIHAPFVFTYCIVIASILIGIFFIIFVCVEFVRYRDIESDLENLVSQKVYI
jgi:hypothetical protein